MRISLPVLAITFVFQWQAQARIEMLSAMKVETDVPTWDRDFGVKVDQMKTHNSYPAEGYTECRPVQEVKSAYLCLSNTQKGMNSSLGRASFFVEGLGDPSNKGKVKKQSDPTYQAYKTMIGGHDLKGSDLNRFHQAVSQECASSKNDPEICYNPYEQDIFQNFILPKASQEPNFVVITFAHTSSFDWRDVVTHEVMHAQYFNQPVYQKVVDAFWKDEVPESDKVMIRERLGQNYDASDELLMKNEFQAYILMSGAEYSELARFVGQYREPLMKRLQDAGVRPVQVQ